ncbi:MAG: helix-turn-helix domain-containing protein [Clostridia bacterium]|nr:helix-turn-helix domain-containing protein [Clostridia bacterium]
MKRIDIQYVTKSIGDLAGVPVRIYEDGEPIFFHSRQDFTADPIKPYLESVLSVGGNIGYFVTPYFNYYGVVRSGKYAIVIGPSRLTPMREKDIRELAFSCDVEVGEVDRFIAAMRGLVQMPLESILEILCTVNHVLSGDKLSISDVAIYDIDETASFGSEEVLTPGGVANEYGGEEVHNTLAIESQLLDMVKRGDTVALDEWVKGAPAVRGGRLADDAARQMKNTFIVATTLASRAAIQGGVDAEEALSLSDSYIRKCEIMSTADQILNLQYRMILDYTARVEKEKLGRSPSRLVGEVARYVRKNISGRTSVEDMARTMFISRTHLAKRFKEETGKTLTDYILTEKTEEAKRLLKHTDKSLSAISEYLGFSSQSHFARVFKKYADITPSEYREK